MKFKPYDVKAQTEMEFVATMVMKSVELLDSYNSTLKLKFLHGFIAHLVLSTLKKSPKQPCGTLELYEYTKNNLLNTKIDIQECVALGFSEAMALYAGRHINYDCQIKSIDTVQPTEH